MIPSARAPSASPAVVSAVYQIAAVNPVTGGRAREAAAEDDDDGGSRREKCWLFRGVAGGGWRAKASYGASLIATGNDGGRGVCSGLEVSKNFKFSYSTRARACARSQPRIRHIGWRASRCSSECRERDGEMSQPSESRRPSRSTSHTRRLGGGGEGWENARPGKYRENIRIVVATRDGATRKMCRGRYI